MHQRTSTLEAPEVNPFALGSNRTEVDNSSKQGDDQAADIGNGSNKGDQDESTLSKVHDNAMLANTAEEIKDKNLNNVSRVNTEEGELEERASLRSPNE